MIFLWVTNIKCRTGSRLPLIWHVPIVISINSAGYESNTKSWMLFKFSEFFYKNIFRRAPEFEGHGSSLFYAISIVPEHVVSSVHL